MILYDHGPRFSGDLQYFCVILGDQRLFLRTISGVSKDFLRTLSGLSQKILRTSTGLLKTLS